MGQFSHAFLRSLWTAQNPAKGRARYRCLLQRGIRQAHRLGFRHGIDGIVKITHITEPSSIILNQWKRVSWRQYRTQNYIEAAVWMPNDQKLFPVVLRKFVGKIEPITQPGIYSAGNLISNIIYHHEAIENQFDELVEKVVKNIDTKEKDLAEALVALAVDDLRIDLYDELKRYVIFGKVRDHYSLNQIYGQGLLWDDLTIPNEVKSYFTERHQFNPVAE